MPLPNPSMTFTPFDILTAQEMNDLVENDQALAAGTGLNAGAISTAALADGSVTGSKLNLLSQTWTPTWTNLVVTSSTVSAKYAVIGKAVFCSIDVVIAGGGFPTGSVSFSLPVTSISYTGTSSEIYLGSGEFLDSGTAAYLAQVRWVSTTTAQISVNNASGTYVGYSAISGTVPMTWANGDEIHISFWYLRP